MHWWEGLILAVVLVLVVLIVVYSFRAGISPMPSGLRVKAAVLALLSPEEQGVVVDLGSGWGSLVFPVAHRCPQARVIGYELSPVPWLVSRCRLLFRPQPNLTLRREDFFQASLDDATVVLCYLYTGAMQRLRDKLRDELKPGARVISHTFAIPDWKPAQVLRLQDMYRTPIYVYEIPESLPAPS